MLRHVVLLSFKKDTPTEAVTAIADGLAGLPAQVPEIAAYKFGSDLGLAEGNSDFAIVADFVDEASYVTYRDHPVHRQLIADLITPVLADRRAVQFTLG